MEPTFSELQWRLAGPFRGGRVSAVAGHPGDALTFYFGACAGGVFKTENGGMTWRNVSDGFFRTGAVGALAVAPSDPNVLYAGMGEANIRSNVSHGDGVYRSTDAGSTWQAAGLADTRHIARLAIHPANPDVIYVAALGHIYGPHPERGLYRSLDGGRHWRRVLYRDAQTGAIDVVLDPHNPRVVYAALWQASRTPYGLTSGGGGSGLFKSTDGGDHWVEVTAASGLPAGPWGRVGIAPSARRDRLWATIEAPDGGVFGSEDGGRTWEKRADRPELALRPWYFSRLTADPVNPEVVYDLNLDLWRSGDGGRTFTRVPTPHADHHDLWIDPREPRRMISGHDGGACVSQDGGQSWSSVLNQPTAQFYHVTVDHQKPYRIYGAQQDNSTLAVPSRSDAGAITLSECYSVGGGESGFVAVRPDAPHIVYAGSNGSVLTRYDHRSRQRKVITPWPEEVRGFSGRDLRYRFAWTFPVVLSPQDPDTLYVGANVVFRSRDEGQSWEVMSGDLTRHDPDRLGPSGGPITRDNGGAEMYGTLATLAPSPVDARILWAGSDDGLIHVTQDAGQTWRNVTPEWLPPWALISCIEASPHAPQTAYVAATRYKSDDPAPYVLKTVDGGNQWESIADGIGSDEAPRVIRQDPQVPGLLFLGTERGLYLSGDEGRHWQRFQNNLPVAPVYDLIVHDDDLIVATHGRSFWILDDMTPLRALAGIRPTTRLLSPRKTHRYRGGADLRSRGDSGYASTDTATVGWERRPGLSAPGAVWTNAGENPPNGVVVHYVLSKPPREPLRLEFADALGTVIQSFTGDGEQSRVKSPMFRLGTEAGLHRFVWDLRYPDAEPLPGAVLRGGNTRGPLAPPGLYRVALTVDGEVFSATWELAADPRLDLAPEEHEAQFRFLLAVRDQLSAVHRAAMQIRRIRTPLVAYLGRLGRAPSDATLRQHVEAVHARLDAIEEVLTQPRAHMPLDYLKYPPGLNVKLAALKSAVEQADGEPTSGAQAVLASLTERADEQFAQLRTLIQQELPPLLDRLASQAPLALEIAEDWRSGEAR